MHFLTIKTRRRTPQLGELDFLLGVWADATTPLVCPQHSLSLYLPHSFLSICLFLTRSLFSLSFSLSLSLSLSLFLSFFLSLARPQSYISSEQVSLMHTISHRELEPFLQNLDQWLQYPGEKSNSTGKLAGIRPALIVWEIQSTSCRKPKHLSVMQETEARSVSGSIQETIPATTGWSHDAYIAGIYTY